MWNRHTPTLRVFNLGSVKTTIIVPVYFLQLGPLVMSSVYTKSFDTDGVICSLVLQQPTPLASCKEVFMYLEDGGSGITFLVHKLLFFANDFNYSLI